MNTIKEDHDYVIRFADDTAQYITARCHMEAVILAVGRQIGARASPLIIEITGSDGTSISRDCYLWLHHMPIHWTLRWRDFVASAAYWALVCTAWLLLAGTCWFVWECVRWFGWINGGIR